MGEIVIIIGVSLVQWLVYTLLLWLMIKVQKLQYNVLGLLGSSLLATALDHIPVVGCYLSWAVLVLCLWKVTHADIVPDVVFTVAVAGAIMFCLNLWAFAALIGTLNPNFSAAADDTPPAFEEMADNDEPGTGPSSEAAEPVKEPVKETAARAPASPASTLVGKIGKKVEQAFASGRPAPAAEASAQATHGLVLKGVVLQSNQPSAMLLAGSKYYTIEEGEVLSIPVQQGKLKVRCNDINRSSVSLTLNDAQNVVLRVR